MNAENYIKINNYALYIVTYGIHIRRIVVVYLDTLLALLTHESKSKKLFTTIPFPTYFVRSVCQTAKNIPSNFPSQRQNRKYLHIITFD